MTGALLVSLLAQHVVVSVVHQPVEAFVSAFGAKVRGVGLYSVRACVLQGTAQISGGRMLQVAESAGVSPVDHRLVGQLAAQAKRQSRLYRIARVVEWAAFLAAFLTASGAVAAPDAVKVALPILGLSADRIGSELWRREYGSIVSELIDPDRAYALSVGACAGGSFVGAYREPFRPVIVGEVR